MPKPFAVHLLISALLLFGGASVRPVQAQGDEAAASKPHVDSLLLRGKTLLDGGVNRGSTDSLKQARALFKQAVGGSDSPALAHYYAALADYRLVNQLPDDAEDRREQTLNDAIDHLTTATDRAPKMADAWALLAGCYGQMMGLHPMRGMYLGPKSSNAIETAKSLAPENPRVWIISGTQEYFTPSLFGGDKEQALQEFEKAARLAGQETIDDPLTPSWGHAEAYAWIGVAHMNAERYSEARTAFQHALDVNPDYGWVKAVLLPKLNAKQS